MYLKLAPYNGAIQEKVFFENQNQYCPYGVRAYKVYSFKGREVSFSNNGQITCSVSLFKVKN